MKIYTKLWHTHKAAALFYTPLEFWVICDNVYAQTTCNFFSCCFLSILWQFRLTKRDKEGGGRGRRGEGKGEMEGAQVNERSLPSCNDGEADIVNTVTSESSYRPRHQLLTY